jgi:DNA-binding SARP family transcriptional activator
MESLLAYLLLHRDAPQPRQHLAFVLWPDSTERQARTNLRHLLHNLRRALPDPDLFLDASPGALQFRTDAPIWFDVAAFEEALRVADEKADEGERARKLKDAVDAYTGDLLEGSYDEWLLDERERLSQRHLAALERLTALLEGRGDHVQAIQYAERLLRLDPLREETYQLLMRLHDARGDRARALRTYHACVAALERELGVEPSPATRKAYEALLPVEAEVSEAGLRTGPVAGPPLVGRAAERVRLTELWGETERGGARFVLVTGQAGIGKSRLIEEVRSWCAHRGARTAQARSYQAEGDLAYGPVAAWLRSEAFKPALVALDRVRLTELARVLPELLVDVPDLPRPEPLPEGEQRPRLYDALVRGIHATRRPVFLVLDDVQWCDPDTLQFLHYLVRMETDTPLLVAATVRREEIEEPHPLNDVVVGLRRLDRFAEIDLGPLTREETALLAGRLAMAPLAEAEADGLYAETEGNPLFVVETLRAGLSAGRPRQGRVAPGVQAVIESRLARLSEPARDLLGVAATIGRAFTSDLLAAASEAGEDTLVRVLDELWRRGILREHGADSYDFGHDKIREVASLSLSPARRRHLHLRVARAVERLHALNPGPVSAQLASHYDLAGAVWEAIPWYARAGGEAQRAFAHTEAIRLLDRGLELVGRLPEGRERKQRELALLIALLVPEAAAEGFSSSRLIKVQRRATALEEELGVEPSPPLLRSVALTSLAQGEFDEARRVGGRLRDRGERDADSVLVVEGHYVLGISAFWQGGLETAREHFEAAIDRYRPEHRATHLTRYLVDPKVVCLGRLANIQWYLGFAASAVRARDSAVALAEEIGDPTTRGTALVFAALLAFELRDQDGFRRYVRAMEAGAGGDEGRTNELSREGMAAYLEVLEGRREAGLARIQSVLDDAARAQPAPGLRAWILRLLMEACLVTGDASGGLAATELGLPAVAGVRLWEAETHRLRAAFLAALDAPPDQIEAELGLALDMARRQGARALELRGAKALFDRRMARGDQEGAAEAARLVAAILEGFPEGRDAPEVREAASIVART